MEATGGAKLASVQMCRVKVSNFIFNFNNHVHTVLTVKTVLLAEIENSEHRQRAGNIQFLTEILTSGIFASNSSKKLHVKK